MPPTHCLAKHRDIGSDAVVLRQRPIAAPKPCDDLIKYENHTVVIAKAPQFADKAQIRLNRARRSPDKFNDHDADLASVACKYITQCLRIVVARSNDGIGRYHSESRLIQMGSGGLWNVGRP